jgi:hypothetical protein
MRPLRPLVAQDCADEFAVRHELVIATRDEWEDWTGDHLLLDSVQPLADNIDRALECLTP